MKLHELLSQIGIILLILTETLSVTDSDGICPQQLVACTESIILCRSAQWLRWRVVFEDSLALSDITREYISSDPVGHTHEATGNGLSFSFNLTFNNQSQLVSIMSVTRQIITNSTINITVHCGQDTHQLSWIAVQDPPVPVSPVITIESIVGGDSHGITIMLELLSDSSESVVDSYIINVSPPIASMSTFTTDNTSIQLFMLYNQDYNISVVATNCVGNSTPTETNVKIGYCVHNKFNVTVTANNSGLAIIYYCRLTVSGDNSSIEPTAAICTTNGNWSTNPNKLECGSNTVTMPITSEASTSTRASTFTTSTDPSIITSLPPAHNVLLISILLVVGLLLAVMVIIFITAVLVVYNQKGKSVGDHDSNVNPSLSEGNGGEEQINEGIILEEQGIYSLLQAESENKLNDSEKKEAHGQLIYVDIGTSVAQHTTSISAMPYPSLSLQLDDSQVQYADINPHQSTTNHNNIIMVVEAEAGTASPTAFFLSDDSLNLDTLLIQLRSEVTLKWREFGLAVGLVEDLLDKYSMYPPEECIVEVLDVWLRNYDCDNTDASMIRKPTWWDVARALREIELHQLANNILSLCKDGEYESDIMNAVPKQHNYIPLANDELPPPLPPKVINLDEEMEPLPQQEELGTPPPLPPPYNETSLKQTFCSSVPPIPPKNNLQT